MALQSKQDHIQAEGEISVTKMCTPLANSAAASLLVAGTPPLTSFRVILELRVAVEPARSPTRPCGVTLQTFSFQIPARNTQTAAVLRSIIYTAFY